MSSERERSYGGPNPHSLILGDVESLDEHSLDDSAGRVLRVRANDLACQIGSSAEVESALEHVADVVEDFGVEADLPLIELVSDAARAQENVVVVVGAVQPQLFFMGSTEPIRDSSHEPCNQNDPRRSHFFESLEQSNENLAFATI